VDEKALPAVATQVRVAVPVPFQVNDTAGPLAVRPPPWKNAVAGERVQA
jgi:hypothetical protein